MVTQSASSATSIVKRVVCLQGHVLLQHTTTLGRHIRFERTIASMDERVGRWKREPADRTEGRYPHALSMRSPLETTSRRIRLKSFVVAEHGVYRIGVFAKCPFDLPPRNPSISEYDVDEGKGKDG